MILLILTILSVECTTFNRTRSSKRGICIAPEYFKCDDVSAFTGISWYYNWGTHPNGQDHPECSGHPPPAGTEKCVFCNFLLFTPLDVTFVPMIWGYWGQQFPALEQFDTILGFNEPNHVDQSNMDPETAAYAWLELQVAYPDKILVSPSASPPTTEQWFDDFFQICEAIGCRIDYLGKNLASTFLDANIPTPNPSNPFIYWKCTRRYKLFDKAVSKVNKFLKFFS